MKINLSWDSSVSSAPAGFEASVQQAAAILDKAILNPVTATIQVGWNEIAGTPMSPGSGGMGGASSSVFANFSAGVAGNNQQAISLLATQASLNDVPNISAPLPSSDPFAGNGYIILSSVQAKIFGVPNPGATGFDGEIGLAEPSYTTPDEMISAAVHEIAHALGRVNGYVSGGAWYTPMDLYTYSAPGQLWNPSSTTPGYFSLDKGVTNLATFSADDPGDFSAATTGPFSVQGNPVYTLSPLDDHLLQILGFAVATNTTTLAPNTVTHTAANTDFTGSGNDTIAFSGTQSQYHIDTTTTPGTITVQDTVANRDGAAAFSNVTRLNFADQTVAFDLGATQSTGQAAELLSAAFGHSAISDKVAMGDWIKFFDGGGTLAQAAADLVGSGTISASDNPSFVTKVWQNVVGTTIDTTDLNNFTADLTNGTFTQASLLALAAQTPTNQITQGLSTLAQSGVDFTPVATTGSVNSVTYTNPSTDYTVTGNAANNTVTVTGTGITDPLVNVQRIHFSDQTIAFDLGANQSAGEAVLLLNAALGSAGIANKTVMGSTIATLDGGSTLTQVAQNLLTSGAVSYASNTDMVTKVWQNVVGSPVDAADLALFTTDLANGTFTQASLLALAAETGVNQTHVGLVGMVAHGVDFVPAT
jgi:hypothetical protein